MSIPVKWLFAVGLCTATHMLFAAPAARASCIAPLSCVCESWPAVHVLHGRIAASDDGRVKVEALDVLATNVVDPVHAGDHIEGLLEVDTCGVETPAFASGDEVLALWRGWPQSTLLSCPEYTECESVCDASTGDEACTTCRDSARIECPRNAELPPMVLVAWGPELDLGDGRVLASDEAGLLGNLGQCLVRFPAPPPEPCDDNPKVGVSDSCATYAPGATDRAGAIALLASLMGFALLRRRRVPR